MPAILAAAEGTELEVLVPFFALTGLRRSETCALRWSDVNLESARISVRRAAVNIDRDPATVRPGEAKREVIVKTTKTRGSERTEALPSFVVTLLKRHRTEQAQRHLALGLGRDPEGLVFDRRDARPWDPNEMSRQFSRLVRKHKLPSVRLHDLRHLFASMSFESGASLKAVSSALGHSSVGVTSAIYIHLADETKHRRAADLETYVGDRLQPAAKGDAVR